MRLGLGLAAVLAAIGSAAFAAGGKAAVAPGFPAWEGAVDANRIQGRPICASDLRHKVTVVIDFDGMKLAETLKDFAYLATIVRFGADSAWLDYEMPTGCIVVMSNRRKKDVPALVKYLGDVQNNAYAANLRNFNVPVYTGVTFPGAPDPGDAPVYCYVMGPSGTEPLWKGALDGKTAGAAKYAAEEAMKKLPAWKPLTGPAEAKVPAAVQKAIDSGKPLDKCYAALLAAVRGKDEAAAREAQVTYDALERTRSDSQFLIRMLSGHSPSRTACELDEFARRWPTAKKDLAEVEKKYKGNKDFETLGKALAKIRAVGADGFSCKSETEAKKLQGELRKLLTLLEPLKESKHLSVQNDAFTLVPKLEAAIESLPGKVAAK